MMKITGFTQKIIAGFLVNLIFMALLGAVSYTAFIKMEHLSSKLNQTLLLDMFLDETMSSHLKWINDLTNVFLIGQEFKGDLDQRSCDFGKWFYSFIPPDREIRRLHEKIETPHRLLHESAREILQLHRFKQMEFDRMLADIKNEHLDWIYKCYKIVESKDKEDLSLILLTTKTCSFISFVSDYTKFPLIDEETREYIQFLARLHQNIHQLMERAVFLGGQGKWDEVKQVFKEKISPANEELLKYFTGLENLVHRRIKDNQNAMEIYISKIIPAMEEVQTLVNEIRSILMKRIDQLEKEYKILAENSRNFIILTILLSLILAILSSLLIPPTLTKPITQLTQWADRIATEGDFCEIITIQNKDEIGQLGNAFNKMIQALRNSRIELEEWGKTLEKKVDSRTKDLQEAYRQLEATQEHLVQSSKLATIGELAAGMAHEINNPMTIIINYTELLLDEIHDRPEAEEYCRGILNMGQRISDVIQKLLTFARQDSQRCTISSIPELIDEVLTFLKKHLENKKILVEKYYEPDLPLICVRRSQLEQVFFNLIINAKDALLEKPESATEQNQKLLVIQAGKIIKELTPVIRISFRDNGIGIIPEDAGRIFDPFFTTKRENKGTGLGLSISYGIIKEHGGNIQAESKRGEFTQFIIDLPIKTNLPCPGEQIS